MSIKELREAVERGDLNARDPLFAVFERDNCNRAFDAYYGSLDAAVALVEAVLPRWTWSVGQNAWHRHFFSHVTLADENEILHDFGATHAQAARALLIATLKALEAQE
jgi:hypothetical protein